MHKKVYMTRDIPVIAKKMLEEKGFKVDVYKKDLAPSHKFLCSVLKKGEYDAMVSLLTDHVDEKLMSASPNLKIISNYAAGYNNIDIDKAKEKKICVTNNPGVSSIAVAEHTIALMLSLTTRLVEGDLFVRNGRFKGWAPMNLIGSDFSGKTIALIGVGNIGSRVAKMAHDGFGAKIIYHDVARNDTVEKSCEARYFENIDELIREADIVSLHVPLLPETRHLINERTLKLMKKDAFLINTSRGPVVDENALVSALKSGTIAGAGLDVFEFEPKLAKGLSKFKNVVLTPHIASARMSVREEMAKITAQNIIDFFEGKVPTGKVI